MKSIQFGVHHVIENNRVRQAEYMKVLKGSVNLKQRRIMLVATLLALLVVGCSAENEQKQAATAPQTVKLEKVRTKIGNTVRTFPAEVSPVKTVDMSFEVSGRLTLTNLKTGTVVNQGEVLAKLDPTPFQQQVDEASARLTQAKRDLDRISLTFKKGLASQSELDSVKTNFELAQIAYQRAEQDLSYTELTAVFDAQVSERLVENGTYVRAGEVVARLQDVSKFYFNINVPERLVSAHREDTPIEATAYLISVPDRQYSLEYVEHDTQPDPVTQTYKVVFAAQESNSGLKPGARAVVNVELAYSSYGAGVMVPFASLVGDEQNGFLVWRFDPVNNTVSSVSVDVLHIENNMAQVKSPLTENDLIVAAGANKMREGMLVKPYEAEQ